jgi:hypothetical protein
MRRGGVVVIGAVVLVVGLAVFARAKPIPDVRGTSPTGDSYADTAWVRPLLDAGFCVAFRYDGSSSEVTGHGESIDDSYFIGDETPQPGHWWSRRLSGSTVTVIVRGSVMIGPGVDWDSMPVMCP